MKEDRRMRPRHWLYTIPLGLRSLFRWAQADRELDDELRDHLERKTEECVIPCATYSSVFRSRWSRSSPSNSRSACAQRNNDRNRRGIVNSQCSGRISILLSLIPQSDHGI